MGSNTMKSVQKYGDNGRGKLENVEPVCFGVNGKETSTIVWIE